MSAVVTNSPLPGRALLASSMHGRAPERFCSWSAVALGSTLCAVFVALAGCAAAPAGHRGHDAFIDGANAIRLSGTRPAAQAAQCFEERARFLPLSEFSRDPATATFTYRLRVGDIWFEQVRIAPTGPGSEAEVRVASNLDDKWQRDFRRDRLASLTACLAS